MGKVSIGLRGWRFDEEDVLAADGSLKPIDGMPPDVRDRVVRLTAIVGSPCDACWLIHGDEALDRCNVASAVYGEPLSEVVLCREHEVDFVYWFREEGGADHAGSDELEDAFHGWFADGGRAPDGYEGVDHVDTEPEAIPEPPEPSGADDGGGERIDLREADVDVDLDADYPT